jgi:uncharacterized YkwD family protein
LAVLVLLTGCQRTTPRPNNIGYNNPGPNGIPQSNITAARDRADYYYGVVTGNVSAQTGINGAAPITYNVANGNRVRIIGTYDGYYVAVLPNNQIGLVPKDNTKPAPSTTSTIPTPKNKPGGTPMGGQTGTPAGTPDNNVGGQAGAPQSGAPSQDATTMVTLVNQARAQAGLRPLNSNNSLSGVAALKASDIAAKNYFSHNSPTYGSPFDMMKKYGISYLYAGENLALNQNVQAAETALMNSPDHKANILSPNFTDIGIGIAKKSDGSKVYVQMFIGK